MANIDDDGNLTEQRLERMRNEFQAAQERRRQLRSSSTSKRETDDVRPDDVRPANGDADQLAATAAREIDGHT